MYHKQPIIALWLEEGDLVEIKGYSYEVTDLEYDGDMDVIISLLDEEGYAKQMTVTPTAKVTALMWVEEEAVI